MTNDSLEHNGSNVNSISAEVNAMGCSWKYLKIENTEILSPCYRFYANIALENGDTSTQYIEVPRMKKYFEKSK
jgi:hypothetical protein